MNRVPEPELMDDEAQARAYAQADFSEPHTLFVDTFRRVFPGASVCGQVLDMGCGPADVTARFARAFPECSIDAVDGAESMLKYARERLAREDLSARVRLIHGRLPNTQGLQAGYEVLIANSLLHHLSDPATLWETIKRLAKPGTLVFIMDLSRPATEEETRMLVESHAGNEPEILKRDFFNSLRAAYRPEEIVMQLQQQSLAGFKVEMISDRHLIVYGRL